MEGSGRAAWRKLLGEMPTGEGLACLIGRCAVQAWSSPQGSADSWLFWGQQWPAFKFQLSRPEWPRA